MAEIATKKVTRKVIKKAVSRLASLSGRSGLNPEVKPQASEEQPTKTRKTCYFCESKATPSYTDLNTLRKFLTERGKIVPKLRSGQCSKHQRRITSQIKYARHLALLPFTSRV